MTGFEVRKNDITHSHRYVRLLSMVISVFYICLNASNWIDCIDQLLHSMLMTMIIIAAHILMHNCINPTWAKIKWSCHNRTIDTSIHVQTLIFPPHRPMIMAATGTMCSNCVNISFWTFSMIRAPIAAELEMTEKRFLIEQDISKVNFLCDFVSISFALHSMLMIH